MVSISSRSGEQGKEVRSPEAQGLHPADATGSLNNGDFPATAPAANPVFYRTYSRRQLQPQRGKQAEVFPSKGRETWSEVCDRTLTDIAELGQFTPEEQDLINRMQRQLKALISGRALWVMGTDWIHQPENFSGAYNCTSTNVVDWRAFGLMMDLAMMGCGTGAVLEPKFINRLPAIVNRLHIQVVGQIGATPVDQRQDQTRVHLAPQDPEGRRQGSQVHIQVGDSRRGWVDSYQVLMELAADPSFGGEIQLTVDLSDVRPAGEILKGFGGVANPIKLPTLYERCAAILNKAVGRQLNSVECCLLIDEAASCIVAGNIRRSAGMRQFDGEDLLGSNAKDNLWQQDENGNWRIDPERDALRMANHTRVFHRKPTREEIIEAVRKQFYSGEGAIQWAGEAVARANCDLIPAERKSDFLRAYEAGTAKDWLQKRDPSLSEEELEDRIHRYGLNPCGEIIGSNYHCVAGDTYLITEEGMSPIRDLVGQTVRVWNGQRWSPVTPMQTGSHRQLYRVSFNDGSYLDVTDGHRFFVRQGVPHRYQEHFQKTYQEMTTAELLQHLPTANYALHTEPFQINYEGGTFVDPIYAYTLGQLVGDGSASESMGRSQLYLKLYGDKNLRVQVLGKTSGELRRYVGGGNAPCLLYTGLKDEFDVSMVRALKYTASAFDQLATWNRDAILHFVAGLADADGCETEAGGIRIYLSEYERAYRVYLLLLKCGIRSSINLVQKAGSQTNYGIRNYDLWYLQITNCRAIPCQRLDTSNGHQPLAKGKWQVIRSIEPLPGLHDSFCFNEAEFHKGVFGGTLTGQCNLSEIHLNQIDPYNYKEQEEAFAAGSLAVAALLNHRFQEPRYQRSREWDPIVGVSFTGLFDFFVKAFGVEWLRWWQEGRPETMTGLAFKRKEQEYLSRWREVVHQTVWDYCDRHGLRRPNRCTTVQPAGCLDRTALRIFDQGLLYADEVVAPGSGETQGLALSVRQGIPVDTAIANQPLNLIRITLENGRILRMTPNHRLSIQGKWVRADHLTIGMEIDHALGEYRKQEDALLLSVDSWRYTRNYRRQSVGHSRGVLTQPMLTPTTLNPDLGYFLGCLFGDGAVSEHKHRIRFAFNTQESDLVDRLQAIAQRWFGLTGTVQYDSREQGSRGELVFASKQLFDWLHCNGLSKPCCIDLDRIPLAIRRSSRETILSFFCGLIDTDGCVREAGSLSIDSANEAFIRNLQQVGEAVGLSFSIFHNTQGSSLQAIKNMWGLSLSRMVSQPDALAYLNAHSRKCKLRPLPAPKRQFAFHPYQITAIEVETTPDYSYDFAVAGMNDDDSWYWQGALKSHNTKSLLTGASPGWHPPKAQRYIRRITFGKNDPVALACLEYGYSIVPSQSDKDENGNLLNDPFDPRCTEWLVELPVEVPWANLPGADQIEIEQFSALAQFDFYMQVQQHYTTHNTSATIELREDEVEALGSRIFEVIRGDGGYMSAALLARFDAPFPRLPFEKIDKATYERLSAEVLRRRQTDDFLGALMRYDRGFLNTEGPAGCDAMGCLLPEAAPQS